MTSMNNHPVSAPGAHRIKSTLRRAFGGWGFRGQIYFVPFGREVPVGTAHQFGQATVVFPDALNLPGQLVGVGLADDSRELVFSLIPNGRQDWHDNREFKDAYTLRLAQMERHLERVWTHCPPRTKPYIQPTRLVATLENKDKKHPRFSYKRVPA